MIDDLGERVTRFKYAHYAYFTDSAFVASFDPYDVGHVLSDSN